MAEATNNKTKETTKAESTGKLQAVSPSDFSKIKINPTVLRQVAIGYMANQQRSTADVKTRGDVSGGGRKPWRQKGTGRARTGSSRNPVWRGGGIVFGPSRDRNYSKILPQALRRQALAAALSLKAKDGRLSTVKLAQPLARTQEVKLTLPDIYALRRVLLVVPSAEYKTAFKNLANVTPVSVMRVNALDVMSAHNVIFINDTYTQIKSRF